MKNNEVIDTKFDADAQVKLESAHDLVQRPDKFAEVFVKAAETQTSIKLLIRKEIKDSLALDPDSRSSLKDLIAEQFREDWRAFVKSAWGKIGLLVWTVIVALVTGWAVHTFLK
jgi:Ni,Fe-hydrogenase III large subunit